MSGLCVRTMCTLSFSQRGRQPEEVTGSHPRVHKKSPDLTSEDSILVRDTGIEPARGRIFRAREAPINLSLAEGASPRRSLVHTPGTQKIPGSNIRGFHTCARYWDRTSDLFRVREARYRCANRAQHYDFVRGEDGIRTRVHGFAGRCLTTRPPHRIRSTRERVRTLGVLTSG